MPEIETSGALLEVARSFRPRILAERDHIEASRRLPEDLARPRNILTATIGLPNAPRGRTDRSEPGAPIEKAICG